MVPDTIEVDLSTLTSSYNRDRAEQITRLLRQILYSPEITPAADDSGEWPQDFSWEIDNPKIILRKVEHETLRQKHTRK